MFACLHYTIHSLVTKCIIIAFSYMSYYRVWFWFYGVSPVSQLVSVKEYALYVMVLTGMEALVWVIGIYILPQDSKWRWLVFVVAIILSFRLPRTFLPNDFHGMSCQIVFVFLL